MNRIALVSAALVALAPAFATAFQDKKEKERKDPAPIPGWIPELADGFAEARKTGKPLMIVFR